MSSGDKIFPRLNLTPIFNPDFFSPRGYVFFKPKSLRPESGMVEAHIDKESCSQMEI